MEHLSRTGYAYYTVSVTRLFWSNVLVYFLLNKNKREKRCPQFDQNVLKVNRFDLPASCSSSTQHFVSDNFFLGN